MIKLTPVNPQILLSPWFIAVERGFYLNTEVSDLYVYQGGKAYRLSVGEDKPFVTDEEKHLCIRLTALEYKIEVHSVGDHLWSFGDDPDVYTDEEALEYLVW